MRYRFVKGGMGSSLLSRWSCWCWFICSVSWWWPGNTSALFHTHTSCTQSSTDTLDSIFPRQMSLRSIPFQATLHSIFIAFHHFLLQLSPSYALGLNVPILLPTGDANNILLLCTYQTGAKIIRNTGEFLSARRYASAGICCSISVCVSPACFVSELLNVSTKFFYHVIAPSFEFFINGRCLTPTASLLTWAPNTRGEKIGRFFTIKSVYLGNGGRYGLSC